MVAHTEQTLRLAILGASGYTGAELLRFLVRHPRTEICALTAERQAGKAMAEVFPHLGPFGLPALVKIDQVDWSRIDLVFCALPHGTTQEVIAALPGTMPVIDLSADFRLRDIDTYATWYGHPHYAPALQEQAVYGLSEFYRPEIRAGRLIACPGCYPTAILPPLIPLLEAGVIAPDPIIVDAKSGVSGAGRDAKQATHFCEAGEGVHAYGLGGHRHQPELEQELGRAAGGAVGVSFTPHLLPMNRGELATIYVRLTESMGVADVRACWTQRFADEPFLKIAPEGQSPATRSVRGSNLCLMNVFPDRRPGWAIIIAAIDNLTKGSSGQAIQNMNLMIGAPETLGIDALPMMP